MGHVKKRDDQEIHNAVVEGVCDGCKGNPDYCNLNDCSMYGKEYDEIEKEWGDEDREREFEDEVHDTDMGARG